MPLGTRDQQRMQAKISRRTGIQLYLLIPPEQSTSTDTPYNISAVDQSVDLSQCTKVKIYASFTWKTGDFTYTEGGQVLTKVAQVSIAYDYQEFVTAAYAIETVQGEVLVKTKQALNESQTMYILTCESNINTKQ